MIWKIYEREHAPEIGLPPAVRWGIVDIEGYIIIPPMLIEDQAHNLVRLHNQDVIAEHDDSEGCDEPYCWCKDRADGPGVAK